MVAFDFDGTLTVRDSYTAFLRWRAGPKGFALGVASLAPALVGYVWTRDRGELKRQATKQFLGRVDRVQLKREARRFCDEKFELLIRPDALRVWREWGEADCERVIVTASPRPIVKPFAIRLGADKLIATRMLYGPTRLDYPNCRGPEKVARLEAAYGRGMRLVAAYGDTAGDREMLAIADRPGMKVFTARP